jgi:hypothetical protein
LKDDTGGGSLSDILSDHYLHVRHLAVLGQLSHVVAPSVLLHDVQSKAGLWWERKGKKHIYGDDA